MIEDILTRLDTWVGQHGKGTYWGEGELPKTPDRIVHDWEHPIQQVRAEIYAFAKALWDLSPRIRMLEIGLGQYGGTRFLWQQLFASVLTIEHNLELIKRLDYPIRTFDRFICGDSTVALPVVKQVLKDQPLDALFIDGGHEYHFVKSDTQLYFPLVRKGGIVGWHDACWFDTKQRLGIEPFLKDFAAGKIDGRQHKIITLDLAHTAKEYGKDPAYPLGSHIGLAYTYVE